MIGISVQNTKELERSFEKYGDEALKEFVQITRTQANTTLLTAKVLAPKNLGTLAQSINIEESKKGLTQDVGTEEPYAPYMEFGTGPKVSVPAEFQNMANDAKGKGGSFEKGLESIKQWCIKVGIDVKAAYPIFITILNKGLTPRPFMYPAFVKAKKTYVKDIKEALKQLNKKFNNG